MLRFTVLLIITTAGITNLMIAVLTPTALAQQTTQITVSPIKFELTGNPGDQLTNQVKVVNGSEITLQLEVRVENIRSTGEEGQVELTEEEGEFALSSWVSATPNRFSLAPKTFKIIDFTIAIPPHAEPGGHYGSLLIGTTASDNLGGTGAVVSQRVGSLLLVRVSGKAHEAGQIKQFYPIKFLGTWEEVTGSDGKTKILLPKNPSTTSPQQYFNHGPLAFVINFKNTGNVHFKPAGYIAVYNVFGYKVAELPIDPRNVFPGGERKVTVIWPKKPLWGGYYRAQVLALYGTKNQPLTATTSFWAFPWIAIVIISTTLVLIVLGRHRLIKVIKVLIRG